LIKIKYLILDDVKNLGTVFDKSFINGSEGDEGVVIVGEKNVVKFIDRLSFSKMNRLYGAFAK
jgi:hypothetical protein